LPPASVRPAAVGVTAPPFFGPRRPPSASGYRLARSCSLDLGNVDPVHGHHGLHRPLRGGAIRILQRRHQDSRHDLPREAPTVPAPAARAFGAAILDDRIPIA